ncbi:MAG: methyltransferase, FkbM family [Verrucomicrobiaceae bacterium]|nr:methyltransferase, FkbM family [Verrucomicrobiaceae bacterium]
MRTGLSSFSLNGATETLTRTACVFYESWDQHLQKWGITADDIVRKLELAGFQVFSGIKERSLQRALFNHLSVDCEDLVAVRTLDVLLERAVCALL